MATIKRSETLMLQDVWRRAYKDGVLNLNFKTKAGAIRARLQLYGAARPVKEGKVYEDWELTKAVETLEIVWTGETSLRLRPKSDGDAMQGIMEALGKNVEEYVDPEMAASAERMLKELGGGLEEGEKPASAPAEHQDNPFYGRRDG